MELSNAGSLDLKYIRDLYRISFPDVERKPFSLIERKAAMGTMEILMMSEGGERMGLAITASDGELVLLDYFAVDPFKRGQGAGSEALQLLLALYNDRQFFLEIERPVDDAPNLEERILRKQFYLKNGMLETGIKIRLFGIPMELLTSRPGLTFEACRGMYRELYGPMYQKVVSLESQE